MNIQNLSTETIQRLITLAIESSPTKAAHILLENVIVPEKIVSAKPIEDELTSMWRNRRRVELANILSCVKSDDRVGAINYLRQYSGIDLKSARDTIESLNKYPKNVTCADSYWANALRIKRDNDVVILQECEVK